MALWKTKGTLALKICILIRIWRLFRKYTLFFLAFFLSMLLYNVSRYVVRRFSCVILRIVAVPSDNIFDDLVLANVAYKLDDRIFLRGRDLDIAYLKVFVFECERFKLKSKSHVSLSCRCVAATCEESRWIYVQVRFRRYWTFLGRDNVGASIFAGHRNWKGSHGSNELCSACVAQSIDIVFGISCGPMIRVCSRKFITR